MDRQEDREIDRQVARYTRQIGKHADGQLQQKKRQTDR